MLYNYFQSSRSGARGHHGLATRAWTITDHARHAERSETGFKAPDKSPFARFVSTAEGREKVVQALVVFQSTYRDPIPVIPLTDRNGKHFYRNEMARYISRTPR